MKQSIGIRTKTQVKAGRISCPNGYREVEQVEGVYNCQMIHASEKAPNGYAGLPSNAPSS